MRNALMLTLLTGLTLAPALALAQSGGGGSSSGGGASGGATGNGSTVSPNGTGPATTGPNATGSNAIGRDATGRGAVNPTNPNWLGRAPRAGEGVTNPIPAPGFEGSTGGPATTGGVGAGGRRGAMGAETERERRAQERMDRATKGICVGC